MPTPPKVSLVPTKAEINDGLRALQEMLAQQPDRRPLAERPDIRVMRAQRPGQAPVKDIGEPFKREGGMRFVSEVLDTLNRINSKIEVQEERFRRADEEGDAVNGNDSLRRLQQLRGSQRFASSAKAAIADGDRQRLHDSLIQAGFPDLAERLR